MKGRPRAHLQSVGQEVILSPPTLLLSFLLHFFPQPCILPGGSLGSGPGNRGRSLGGPSGHQGLVAMPDPLPQPGAGQLGGHWPRTLDISLGARQVVALGSALGRGTRARRSLGMPLVRLIGASKF